jgi:hypothetical protein
MYSVYNQNFNVLYCVPVAISNWCRKCQVSEISFCTKVDVSDGILSELQARNNLEGVFAPEVEGRMGLYIT